VIVTSSVTFVFNGTLPKATEDGLAPAASALPGSAQEARSPNHRLKPIRRFTSAPFDP
jgi:hypothetical protein